MQSHKLTEEDYKHFRETLCVERGPEGLEKRKKMFRDFDPNGNGFLSLAETDKGIRDVLKLPDVFHMKQVIMRSFQAAKNSVKSKNAAHGADYIEKNEFRYFLCYLRQYFEYYEMFSIVNTDGDKYLDLQEFKDAVPTFEKWGIKVSDPVKTFKAIDLDHGGKIRFDEFCHWAIKNHLDIDTDDDFDDPCLKKLK